MSISLFVSLLWIAFLAVVFALFYKRYRCLKKITTWPVVDGEVIEFELNKSNETYWPAITYRYEVNGRIYDSSHLFVDTAHHQPQSRSARNLAYRVAQAYVTEQSVRVHYNPLAPQESVLDVRIPLKLKLILGLLLGFMTLEVARGLF